MLLSFSVENFGCFTEKVKFTFEAMEDLSEDNFYNPESRRKITSELTINTVNALFGANGSGKTTLLSGLRNDAYYRKDNSVITLNYLDKDYKEREVVLNKNNGFLSNEPPSILKEVAYYSDNYAFWLRDLDSAKNKEAILKELKEADINLPENYDYSLSKGTEQYVKLVYMAFEYILPNGGLLIVDEDFNDVHPLLRRRFVEIFKSLVANPKHARLLYTSHDVMCLHQSSLNGDQMWFLGKPKKAEAIKLYSPADYEDFNPLTLQSDYILGCYDAVPNTNWR